MAASARGDLYFPDDKSLTVDVARLMCRPIAAQVIPVARRSLTRCVQMLMGRHSTIFRNRMSTPFRNVISVQWGMEMIGDRVRQVRMALGVERKALAHAAGMSYSGLSDLESGKAKSTTRLHLLANALGVSVDWLASGEGPKLPPGFVAEPMAGLTAEEDALLAKWHMLDATERRALLGILDALVKGRAPVKRYPMR